MSYINIFWAPTEPGTALGSKIIKKIKIFLPKVVKNKQVCRWFKGSVINTIAKCTQDGAGIQGWWETQGMHHEEVMLIFSLEVWIGIPKVQTGESIQAKKVTWVEM